MEEKAKKERKLAPLTLTVKVRLEQAKDKELPEVMVYAFDQTGQFLTSATLPKGEQGEVKLELPPELQGTTVRVLLGPPLAEEPEETPPWMASLLRRGEGQKKVPSPAVLVRRGAHEKRVRLHPKLEKLEVSIFPHDWRKWLLCPCVVRGRLIKRLTLPDGTTKDLGVCGACVKIYEVDKFLHVIPRLPERDLFRLRDDLRIILEKHLPQPKVWPPPPPPPPERYRVPGPLLPIRRAEALTPEISSAEALQPEPQAEAFRAETETLPFATQIRAELEPIFMATSASELRTALTTKAGILARFICIWEWLHVHFHTDLIKCVCTDEQGRFETTIWYPCAGDKPDLYFKAVQCIGGTLHTLYDPGVACHTYWDYACGTEVVLEVTDPAARVCVPPPDVDPPPGVSLWVMPYAVGGVRVDQMKSSGLTDFHGWVDVPFGGRLGFRHGYSSAIPIDAPNKPFYYRWLYNKLDSAGNETERREFAEPVAETVVRHYVDEDLAHPGLPPTFPAYPLGPHSVNGMHLYEFKPHQPPQIPGHYRYWPTDDWFGDIYTGILQSASLPGGVADAAGKYKIRLEIYDKNGNPVPPGAGTFQFIVPTGLAADGVTILSRPASPTEIEKITNGGKDYYGFVFYLHVDNNPCQAEIYDASVNGVAAGPCGFISYPAGANVHLSFRAYHPNGFARFKFTVVKGSSGYVGSACAPADPTVAWATAPLVTDSPNGYTRSLTSVFMKDVPVTDVLGGCTIAAFGENLSVVATAINGWVRLSGLDAYALPKAFALEPSSP